MNNKQKFENIKQVKYVLNIAIEKIAKNGDENSIEFPKSFIQKGNFNFSFSGLKTYTKTLLEKYPDKKLVFIIAGDGPKKNSINKIINELRNKIPQLQAQLHQAEGYRQALVDLESKEPEKKDKK